MSQTVSILDAAGEAELCKLNNESFSVNNLNNDLMDLAPYEGNITPLSKDALVEVTNLSFHYGRG